MKNLVCNLFFVLMLCAITSSCNDNDETIVDNILEMSSSTRTVEIKEDAPDEEAVSFKWSTGTNWGTNTAISYTFQIREQGKKWSEGISFEMGQVKYDKAFTMRELQDMALNELKLPSGQESTLEAQVIAIISDESAEDQVSPVVVLKVTPY